MTAAPPAIEDVQVEWHACVAGSVDARELWSVVEGPPAWQWEGDGLRLADPGAEWCATTWHPFGPAALEAFGNFLIEVTVSGCAEGAGISFGPFKDFLAEVRPDAGRRRIQLEVDAAAGRWSFRVDGRVMARSRWDAAVHHTGDLLQGALTFKARQAGSVLFEDFRIRPFSSSCAIAVVVTCYRFQQRLGVTLRNWCHQTLDPGSYEILVVNPESPDGTGALLAAAARSFPEVRIREVRAEASLARNKGELIHRAIRASQADWIWITDADCLFSPNTLAGVLPALQNPSSLYYGRRLHLSDAQTDGLLAGRLDGLHGFDQLAGSREIQRVEEYPWGYTQIVHRSTWNRIPYRKDINHFAHSDDIFAQECRRCNIRMEAVPGLFCLHLSHPFSWWGTDCYL
ncbi:MAG: glycosyltransferase [Acidobacteriota bacterium]|nr:glycosyltransferase [Acidobacteriota bacterium]